MQELWFCSTFLSGHCQVRLAWVLVVWVISLAWNLIQIPWKTLLNGKFSLVTFSALHSLFLSLSHEIRIKKIRILEVLEPLQCEGETGHLLRLQREASCINVFQVDYCNWFFQWIFYAIGYWSGFSLKEFFIGFPLAKTLCLVIVYSLFTGYNLKKKIYIYIYIY